MWNEDFGTALLSVPLLQQCVTFLGLCPPVSSQHQHSLFYSLCLFNSLRAAQYNTHNYPKRKIKTTTKGMKERGKGLFSPWFAQSMLKAKSRERVAANCLSIAHTSISPSNSEESSKVTLKGMVLSRLDPFWGDFRFFGDVFSDISSVSLCSSRCFEFCSCTSIKKQRQSNKTVLDLICFP